MARLTAAQQAEVVRLIPYIARIVRSFRGDEDDFGEAHVTACEAVLAHDPARGPLDRFVGICVRHRLIRLMDRKAKRPTPLGDLSRLAGRPVPALAPAVHAAIAALPVALRLFAGPVWEEGVAKKTLARRCGVSIADVNRSLDRAAVMVAAYLDDDPSVQSLDEE